MRSTPVNRTLLPAAVLSAMPAAAGCSESAQPGGSADDDAAGSDRDSGRDAAVSALREAAELSLGVDQHVADNLIADDPWFLEIPEPGAALHGPRTGSNRCHRAQGPQCGGGGVGPP